MPPVASTIAGASKSDELAGLPPVAEGARDRPLAVAGQSFSRRVTVHSWKTLMYASGRRAALVLLLERDHALLQGADQLQAGTVADVCQPRVLVPAEVTLADLAVLGAVEQRAPGLQLPDPVGGLLGVQLGHPPVVEELAARAWCRGSAPSSCRRC